MKRHARSLGAKCLSCSWQHPDFDVAEGDHVPVVLQPDVALRVFPEARMRRALLAATLGFHSGLPNSYSRSFTPLSRGSTGLPFTMRRAVFHPPPGFTAPRGAGYKSYAAPADVMGFCPSGCLASSSTCISGAFQ